MSIIEAANLANNERILRSDRETRARLDELEECELQLCVLCDELVGPDDEPMTEEGWLNWEQIGPTHRECRLEVAMSGREARDARR